MTKTIALLVDSYRDLNARRLFWIALVINIVAVLACSAMGIKDGAFTIFAWKTSLFPNFFSLITPAEFYKAIFTYFGVSVWLTWVATILALVSTTSIFPDFLAGGSIDIYLSKPISRLWLFVMKYLGGMIFVTLQVTVYAAGNFLLLGIRAGDWEPRLFLAVPLVVAVFSFLYCFCVLLGVLTRSAIASLLLTMLIWLALFGAQTTESILLEMSIIHNLKIQSLEHQLAQTTAPSTRVSHASRFDLMHPRSITNMVPFGLAQESKADLRRELDELKSETLVDRLHTAALVTVTVLPKTQVATNLLRKSLLKDESADTDDEADDSTEFQDNMEMGRMSRDQRERLRHEVMKVVDSRTVSWSLGTSFISEFLVVGLAAWMFCRRDF
jgi:ABC-type transport system involved in multi-copper enzyme maturation permease subunit